MTPKTKVYLRITLRFGFVSIDVGIDSGGINPAPTGELTRLAESVESPRMEEGVAVACRARPCRRGDFGDGVRVFDNVGVVVFMTVGVGVLVGVGVFVGVGVGVGVAVGVFVGVGVTDIVGVDVTAGLGVTSMEGWEFERFMTTSFE